MFIICLRDLRSAAAMERYWEDSHYEKIRAGTRETLSEDDED